MFNTRDLEQMIRCRNDQIAEINRFYDLLIPTVKDKFISLILDVGIKQCEESPNGATTYGKWKEAAMNLDTCCDLIVESIEKDRKKQLDAVIAQYKDIVNQYLASM